MCPKKSHFQQKKRLKFDIFKSKIVIFKAFSAYKQAFCNKKFRLWRWFFALTQGFQQNFRRKSKFSDDFQHKKVFFTKNDRVY